jgi:hypothetical protein
MNAAQANLSVRILDEKTGQEMEGVPAFLQKKQRNGFKFGWSQLRCIDTEEDKDEQGREIMNKIQGLTGESLRLLFSLLLIKGYRNEVMLDPRDLADETGMALPNI